MSSSEDDSAIKVTHCIGFKTSLNDRATFTVSQRRTMGLNDRAVLQFQHLQSNHCLPYSYFEIKIVAHNPNSSKYPILAVGFCPHRYDKGMAGWNNNSVGYHADDGGVFYNNGSVGVERPYFEKCSVGDTMGCGYENGFIFFTRNGVKLNIPEEFTVFYPPATFIASYFPTVTASYEGVVFQVNMIPVYNFRIPDQVLLYSRHRLRSNSESMTSNNSIQRKNSDGAIESECEQIKKSIDKFIESIIMLHSGKQTQIELMEQDITRLKLQLKQAEKSLERVSLSPTKLILTKEDLSQYTLEQLKHIKDQLDQTLHVVNSEIEARKNSDCAICLDAVKNVLFLPCKHVACCKSCSELIQSCPICMTEITEKMSIYL